MNRWRFSQQEASQRTEPCRKVTRLQAGFVGVGSHAWRLSSVQGYDRLDTRTPLFRPYPVAFQSSGSQTDSSTKAMAARDNTVRERP